MNTHEHMISRSVKQRQGKTMGKTNIIPLLKSLKKAQKWHHPIDTFMVNCEATYWHQ